MTETQSATTATNEKVEQLERALQGALGNTFSSLTAAQKEELAHRIRQTPLTEGPPQSEQVDPTALIEEASQVIVSALLEAISAEPELSADDFTKEEFESMIQALLQGE